jgi:hypothetical protein
VLGPETVAHRSRKPPWFKVPAPGSPRYRELHSLIKSENLHTVCQEAACPNIGECWTRGTATFMILGDTCTRRCGFCNVKTGKPTWHDPLEPARVARSVARAVIDALREHPALNAWLDGDAYTRHSGVNLGIAVSLGDDGLIVPVIHGAHELSVEGLAARIRDVAQRARAGKLSPDEVRGGTFTITNPGQYGTLMATPIINQPQVGILDLEAVVKRPVVIDGDAIAVRAMTILGLSWDHRALDGVQAAQFLASVKRGLENVG